MRLGRKHRNGPDDVTQFYGTNSNIFGESGWASMNFNTPVHCNTFNKDIASVKVSYKVVGNSVPTGLIEEYLSRLHGRTLQDDLKLAGMWREVTVHTDENSDRYRLEWNPSWGSAGWMGWYYESCGHGMGFNGNKDGD